MAEEARTTVQEFHAAEARSHHDDAHTQPHTVASAGLNIAFVNNMGPGGFVTAQRQFQRLIDAADDLRLCRWREFTLLGVPALDGDSCPAVKSYAPISEIWAGPVDAIVVTGAEPLAERLPDEPYWPALTALFDQARRAKVPLLLSCLAAHAAVLHWDKIERRRLARKRCGIFRQDVRSRHPLVTGLNAPAFPHSRWNEIDAEALTANGYDILTQAPDGAVDCFMRDEDSLVLAFQGHPEYEPDTLLLEYRRDVRRFLTGATDKYPDLPIGYFSDEEQRRLLEFRADCLAQPHPGHLVAFPIRVSHKPPAPSWGSDATLLCRNWLTQIRRRRRAHTAA